MKEFNVTGTAIQFFEYDVIADTEEEALSEAQVLIENDFDYDSYEIEIEEVDK